MASGSDRGGRHTLSQFNFPLDAFASTSAFRLFAFTQQNSYELVLTADELAHIR
jgi:hypothetical protein